MYFPNTDQVIVFKNVSSINNQTDELISKSLSAQLAQLQQLISLTEEKNELNVSLKVGIYKLLPAKFGADKAKILVESVKNLVRSSENACCLHYTADFEVLLMHP